ncbi:MAG: hypothetical protein K940chlam9_00843 [Chlamydiae bacterium]|nr:hypothetical protein [Chlamydiota bacterium]
MGRFFSRKALLILVIVFGCAFPGAVFYLFDSLPSFSSFLLFESEPAAKKNSELLAESFTAHDERPFERKENLQELGHEQVPPLDLPLPEPTYPSIQLEEEITYPSYSCFQADLETSWQEDLTVAPLTLPSTSSLPPPMHTFSSTSPSFQEEESLAESDHFTIEVEYAQKKSRPGYVFKVTLIPKEEASFKRICNNYYFLLDRSNSIPRLRYALNKRVVATAIEKLEPGDTFNIFVFDNKIVRLGEENLPFSEENVERARAFLNMQGHGGFFAATELYASLGKIIPQDVSDEEVHTAVLLSDGDTYLSLEKQRKIIGSWTLQNKGKVSLFSAASGTGNNLPLLDVISAFNKGALIYSADHRQLEGKLARFIHSIRRPIGKGITATAIPSEKSTTILLQPKKSRLPDLYQDRSYVLYGSTSRLTPFVLFLQGNHYGIPFTIKKSISFEEAKVGAPSLERNWTQLVVQEFYERYFSDGNTAHLDAARQFLSPLNLPTPFTNE